MKFVALAFAALLAVPSAAQGSQAIFGDLKMDNVTLTTWNGAPALLGFAATNGQNLAYFSNKLIGPGQGLKLQLKVEAVLAWISGPCSSNAKLQLASYSHVVTGYERPLVVSATGEGFYWGIPDTAWPIMHDLGLPYGTSFEMQFSGCSWSGPTPWIVPVVFSVSLR